MNKLSYLKSVLGGTASAMVLATAAAADQYNIPSGDLKAALHAYATQSGIALIASDAAVQGAQTKGVQGELTASAALSRILAGTGFAMQRDESGAVAIVKEKPGEPAEMPQVQLAQAAPKPVAAAGIESVVVTSSKIKGDIQTVPIAITALSQEQLTSRQIAGGPDLVKEVPNLTFTKTNFTGYSIQIRGIGTQAISVTTDPAVAVAFNDTPFIRNHFFEQEFYDVGQVEVLRGPQGTLYGRNATAGVVNVISAKPTDQYEAQASVDVGNYNNRRLEGMLNIPLVGDKLDLRVAGEWTKRDGYAFDEQTDQSIDGRDLWSSRVSLLVHPIENLTANLVWEHFNEDDDRMRSTKQLCKRDPAPSEVDGPAGPQFPNFGDATGNAGSAWLSQGCLPVSLYSPEAFETPNAGAIPFVAAGYVFGFSPSGFDAYSGVLQSRDLRVISSALSPKYTAKNDTVELNADYNINSTLTLTSQTGYSKDFLYSTEDYNRFNTAPGMFLDTANSPNGLFGSTLVGQDNEYCDPQLGCSTRLVGEDISQEHAKQISQELRLSSDFTGPFNFSVGANYLHYDTVEDYYVLFNELSLITEGLNSANGTGSIGPHSGTPVPLPPDAPHIPFDPILANACGPLPADPSTLNQTFAGGTGLGCAYVDPNPLSQINGQGHNYFRSQNPYRLTSWAGFGEVYYQVAPTVKLTGGLRWTDDMKSFTEIPSWVLYEGEGFVTTGVLDQEWKEWTGRFNATWSPKLDFTDQSLFYGSYSRGYKGGGANPPGVQPLPKASSPSVYDYPLTFAPEFVNAFELGTKNTLLDGAMTLNGDVFYYDYKDYQISEIVDRTAINLNFNATVKGAELESTWEPFPGLRFNLAGGYENTTLAKDSQAIDLMDRTAGHAGWLVVKPFVTQTSNCVLPTDVVNELLADHGIAFACLYAYSADLDPATSSSYVADPPNVPGYAGFDPTTAPNNGEGFAKDLSGNQLPNAPHFTVSLGGQYTMPLSDSWAGTLRSDFYWQSQSFARVFNDRPYDKLRGYSSTNLAIVFTNSDGWEVMGYVKNVFNVTAITGAFLNSDDTALTTNVFVTDPRLLGVRITKTF